MPQRSLRGRLGATTQSLALRATFQAAARLGYDLHLRDDYYSPMPRLAELPETLWTEAHDLPGVDLGVAKALESLQSDLSPYLAEFHGPDGPGAAGYRIPNGFYDSVDAEVLYAMIRWKAPARVVELGSGNSSRVIGHALERNAVQAGAARYRIFDPYPFHGGSVPAPQGAEVRSVRATDVPLDVFEELEAGDVLFVDTTHTVKTGGDVPHIVLAVLPLLRAGVVVHFHDIFLPYEYPREWVTVRRRAWAEQYLLQAFLAYNETFEVVMPCQALSRAEPEPLADLVPTFRAGVSPGAFWIGRR